MRFLDPSAVVARLSTSPPEGPAGEATVLGESFAFRPQHWLNHWPELPPARCLSGDEPVEVSLRHLYERADRVRTRADAVDLFVLTAGRAAGTNACAVWRWTRPLTLPGAPDVLLRVVKAARTTSPVEVYESMQPGGPNHLRWLGPALGTKLLHVAGYGHDWGEAPAVLDAWIAYGLGLSRTGGWTTAEYEQYLGLLGTIRDQWAPTAELPRVTHALQHVGREVVARSAAELARLLADAAARPGAGSPTLCPCGDPHCTDEQADRVPPAWPDHADGPAPDASGSPDLSQDGSYPGRSPRLSLVTP